MLHRHVETLLQHRILRLNVATWSHILLRSEVQVVRVAARLESALTRVKHHTPLQILVPRQAVRLPWDLIHSLVVPWPWVLRNKVAEETLTPFRSRSSGVEANAAATKHRVLFRSSLVHPLILVRIVDSYVRCSNFVISTYVFTFCRCLNRT